MAGKRHRPASWQTALGKRSNPRSRPIRISRRGWLVDTCCLIEIGAEQLVLTIRNGRPTVADRVAPPGSWEFAIRAGAEAWMALWQPVPRPGWHDLFALAKRGAMRIEGNLHPFMANLQYFKDLVTLPREGGVR